MAKTFLNHLKNIGRFSMEDSDTAQLVRFSLVYITLFFIMLFTSSGALGKSNTAKLSLESFDKKAAEASLPALGSYYLDPKLYKGDYQKTAAEIEELVRQRQDHVDKVNLQERGELVRLREEHKHLMWGADNHGYDSTDKFDKEFSKWNTAMYANISQQSLLKQNTHSKIAAWDAKNHLKVKVLEKDGKKYVVSLRVIREKQKRDQKAVASIP